MPILLHSSLRLLFVLLLSACPREIILTVAEFILKMDRTVAFVLRLSEDDSLIGRFFFSFLGWSGTRSIIIEATTGLLYKPRIMMDDDECGAVGGMLGMGNGGTRRKPAPVPLCPPT
jgi:hypothetical protein